MKKRAFIIVVSFVFIGLTNAQDEQTEERSFNKNGVYIEFGGNSGNHGNINIFDLNIPAMITINYERLFQRNKKKQLALRIGVGYMPQNWTNYSFPFEASYLFGKKCHVLEMGLGASYLIADGGSSHEALVLFGRVGYRYRGKKGLLIRGGFTPAVDFDRVFFDASFPINPYVGISIGYSF